MRNDEMLDIEIDLLLEAIQRKYSYDFSGYARNSFVRRVNTFINAEKISSVGELIHHVLKDEKQFKAFANSVSVNVTEMFRDPFMFRSIRHRLVPYLKSYPKINIWHAGCATGQEVYSLAILLHEEGVKRAEFYATDIDEASLKAAKAGIYSNIDIQKSTANYHSSGGKGEFSDYYHSNGAYSIFDQWLRKNISFHKHDLLTDAAFNEFHLILCRNVMIYFTKKLQSKVLKLFYKSLVDNGFLVLGSTERILSSSDYNFASVESEQKIYKKAFCLN